MSIENKILTLLQFGKTNITEIFRYCAPHLQQTVSRKLRLLEGKGLIECCGYGVRGSKIIYKLTK